MSIIESITNNGDLARSLIEASRFITNAKIENQVRHVIAYLDPAVPDYWWVDVIYEKGA